jgi:HPt (histidine-containing phosphotransfer) domain-containing protein
MSKTDLSFLKELSNGNPKMIQDMVEIFGEQVLEFKKALAQAYNDKDWKKMSFTAHKAKSSAKVMGMKKTAEILEKLENESCEAINIDQYASYIEQIKQDLDDAMEELNTTSIA